jgi:predicted nucleic acid-binding protein
MRIVVDTNIAFSAILNTNSRIAGILFRPSKNVNFYPTEHLSYEIAEHRDRLLKLSGYTDAELDTVTQLVLSHIRLIDVRLIPRKQYAKAYELTHDIDVDDAEFVALAEHSKASFWSGDKRLVNGLRKKGWTRCVTTDELFERLTGSERRTKKR